MQKLANLKAPGLMDGWKITSTTRIIHGWLPSVISAQEYIYYFTEMWFIRKTQIFLMVLSVLVSLRTVKSFFKSS